MGLLWISFLFPGLPILLFVSGRFRAFLSGKERDAESGLDFFGARYMPAAQGRFTSPDPGNVSGLTHMDDPQSWNEYSYVRNNPLKFTDPDGYDYRVCEVDSNNEEFNCGTLTSDKEFEKVRGKDPAGPVISPGA